MVFSPQHVGQSVGRQSADVWCWQRPTANCRQLQVILQPRDHDVHTTLQPTAVRRLRLRLGPGPYDDIHHRQTKDVQYMYSATATPGLTVAPRHRAEMTTRSVAAIQLHVVTSSIAASTITGLAARHGTGGRSKHDADSCTIKTNSNYHDRWTPYGSSSSSRQ